MTQDTEEGYKTNVKGSTRPFDPSRRMTMDPRDPRSQDNQWPCFAHHTPGNWKSNPHGRWQHCTVCAVRLAYEPRVGSPANSTKCFNAEMVKRMLAELEKLLPTTMPNEEACMAMMKKIEADETLHRLVQDLKSKSTLKMPKAKAKTPGTLFSPTPRSPAVVELPVEETMSVSSRQSAPTDLEQLLTAEELNQLQELLATRRQVHPVEIHTPPEGSLAEAYQNEM